MKTFVIFITFCSTLTGFSQVLSPYVILNSGDTIICNELKNSFKGLKGYNSDDDWVRYRKSEMRSALIGKKGTYSFGKFIQKVYLNPNTKSRKSEKDIIGYNVLMKAGESMILNYVTTNAQGNHNYTYTSHYYLVDKFSFVKLRSPSTLKYEDYIELKKTILNTFDSCSNLKQKLDALEPSNKKKTIQSYLFWEAVERCYFLNCFSK